MILEIEILPTGFWILICVFENFKEKKIGNYFLCSSISQFIEFQFHDVNKYKKYWYYDKRIEQKVTRIILGLLGSNFPRKIYCEGSFVWFNGPEPGLRRYCPGSAPRPTPGWPSPPSWAPPALAFKVRPLAALAWYWARAISALLSVRCWSVSPTGLTSRVAALAAWGSKFLSAQIRF